MGTLKPQSNAYSNTIIGTLAVDGWVVASGTARKGLGGLRPLLLPSSKCNSPPIYGKCANFILFDAAL